MGMTHTQEKLFKIKALVDALNEFEGDLDPNSWDPVLLELKKKFCFFCTATLDNSAAINGMLHDMKWHINHLKWMSEEITNSIQNQFEKETQ
jgi:hypothetical protein